MHDFELVFLEIIELAEYSSEFSLLLPGEFALIILEPLDEVLLCVDRRAEHVSYVVDPFDRLCCSGRRDLETFGEQMKRNLDRLLPIVVILTREALQRSIKTRES